MDAFRRYAIYYAPEKGSAWGEFGVAWLGWDAQSGTRPDAPADLPPLPVAHAEITARPRKYGLHGTLKAPFRLAQGTSPDALREAARRLAAQCPAPQLAGLRLARLGHFLALVPDGPAPDLAALALTCTEQLDRFRAPLTEAELAKRRKSPLTAPQERYLERFGYPYVGDEFRFHITLTGPLDGDTANAVEQLLQDRLAANLPRPFIIRDIALFGEAQDGRFHILERFALKAV